MYTNKIDYMKGFVEVYFNIQDEYISKMKNFIESIGKYKTSIQNKLD